MIRNYREQEYRMIKEWWDTQGEVPPTDGMLPEDSTFIYEHEGEPILCVTVFMTNMEVAYIDNFVGNPRWGSGKHRDIRRAATIKLQKHLEEFSRRAGYKRIACMALNERTADYYETLGYQKTVSGLTAFVKEI